MDDHDLLIRIDERVHKDAELIERIECILYEGKVRFKDHDNDIKEIRAWKDKVTGAVTLIGLFVTGIIVYILKHIPFTGDK